MKVGIRQTEQMIGNLRACRRSKGCGGRLLKNDEQILSLGTVVRKISWVLVLDDAVEMVLFHWRFWRNVAYNTHGAQRKRGAVERW